MARGARLASTVTSAAHGHAGGMCLRWHLPSPDVVSLLRRLADGERRLRIAFAAHRLPTRAMWPH